MSNGRLDKILYKRRLIRLVRGTNDYLIELGKVDTNIYVISEGIVRMCHFDGNKEITLGFSSKGTVIVSPFGYSRSLPAHIYAVACNKCIVKKISKQTFDRKIEESHEFAHWVYTVAIRQFEMYEKKLKILSGPMEERYEATIMNRQDIIRNVSSKVIASYLGITNFYLCKIKRKLRSINPNKWAV